MENKWIKIKIYKNQIEYVSRNGMWLKIPQNNNIVYVPDKLIKDYEKYYIIIFKRFFTFITKGSKINGVDMIEKFKNCLVNAIDYTSKTEFKHHVPEKKDSDEVDVSEHLKNE